MVFVLEANTSASRLAATCNGENGKIENISRHGEEGHHATDCVVFFVILFGRSTPLETHASCITSVDARSHTDFQMMVKISVKVTR